MNDVEFRLGRGYFARPLAKGCLALVFAAVLYVADFHAPALQFWPSSRLPSRRAA